jgi:hypothetical protein
MGKAAVLEGVPEHPAVKAILAWNPAALTDAKFDRGELTLTIAPSRFAPPPPPCRRPGYNFFEDMTAVDWFPPRRAFQLSYHILSHALRSASGCACWWKRQPIRRVDYAGLARGQLLRARGLRPVRHSL